MTPTDRQNVLIAAITKQVGSLQRLAKAPPSVKRSDAIATNVSSLLAQVQELSGNAVSAVVRASIPAPSDPQTFAQALATFLDAEDKVLIERGLPHGRNGAERGAMSRDEHIALATSLGVLEALGGPDFFGPAPEPGVLA